MFNNDEYWKNRKAGIRGQGAIERPKFRPHFGSNRRSRRQKLPSEPQFTKPNVEAPGHVVNDYRYQRELPTFPPELSNSKRMFIRREGRIYAKDNRSV